MSKKPNIIFFFSDQQRYDTVGAYGALKKQKSPTPHLDKMAEEGVLFEKAFTPQPVCGPARACIQTGRYATETGCFKNGIPLPPDEKTIAHYCAESGYELGYMGKWHLASGPGQHYERAPVPQELRGGWDGRWLAADVLEFTSTSSEGILFDENMKEVKFKKYRVDAMTDHALDFIEEKGSGDKPFFLFLSYLEPHHQNTTHRYEGPPGSAEKFKSYEVPGDLKGKKGDWEKSYPDYLGCCSSLDENLGRIQALLKEKGIEDETLIIYTSDHGSHFKTRNMEYKRSCHESSIRIPMIAKGPGFKGGKRISELVSLMDIPPTILKAAALDVPETMAGKPLQNLLTDRKEERSQDVFLQISESQVGRAIRTDRWKYSVRAFHKQGFIQRSSSLYLEDFLYDLEEDPFENKNLVRSAEYKAVRAELRTSLIQRMVEAGEDAPRILPKTKALRLACALALPFNSLAGLVRK